MAYCLWHAIEYHGGMCPRCWQEKQQERLIREHERISAEETRRQADLEEDRARREEELADRIEASNLEAAYEMAAAAEEQKRNIANAPRLESQSTSERAWELYQVGLYEDALRTALKALNLDRGNMRACQIAAWALTKQGRNREATQYFQKQVALLNTPDYKNAPRWFRSVFLELPPDDAISRAFSNALRTNSKQWRGSNDSFELIDTLIDGKLFDDAKGLTQNLIANCDSLMLEAYSLEIGARTGTSSTERLSAFLQSLRFDKRSYLLDSFQAISECKGPLSDTTISRIKEALCERYRQWKPEIENEISETAIKDTSGAGFAAGWGCGFIVVCFIGLMIIANVLHSTPLQHLWLVTDGMKIFAPVSVLASIVIGAWGGHLIGGFRKAGNARRKMGAMEQKENQRWQSICRKSISAPRPDPTFVFLELILFLVAFGVIPFGLFSYMKNSQDLAMKAAGLSEGGQRIGVTDTKSQPSTSFGGIYYLYHLEKPASGVVSVMTITLRDNVLLVQGNNEDWKGKGRINGIHGYSDFKYKDGRKGRTTFTVNSDGTLKGHVVGSGEDWWYVARRE